MWLESHSLGSFDTNWVSLDARIFLTNRLMKTLRIGMDTGTSFSSSNYPGFRRIDVGQAKSSLKGSDCGLLTNKQDLEIRTSNMVIMFPRHQSLEKATSEMEF